jgi:hypothetical protein
MRCTARRQRRGMVLHAGPCNALERRWGTVVLAGVAAALSTGAPGTPACRARTSGLMTAPFSSAPASAALGVSGACRRVRPSAVRKPPRAQRRLIFRAGAHQGAGRQGPELQGIRQPRPPAHDARPARAGGRSAATARPTSRARRPTCPRRSSSAASSGAWAARRAPSRTAWACCRRAPARAPRSFRPPVSPTPQGRPGPRADARPAGRPAAAAGPWPRAPAACLASQEQGARQVCEQSTRVQCSTFSLRERRATAAARRAGAHTHTIPYSNPDPCAPCAGGRHQCGDVQPGEDAQRLPQGAHDRAARARQGGRPRAARPARPVRWTARGPVSLTSRPRLAHIPGRP